MMLRGAGTRVLLVGSGSYAPGSGLEPVAAVSSTLADLGQVLVERCGVAAERLRVLRDPDDPAQVGIALAEEAEQATEVLLFYYVGHGVISPGGQLYLSTGATDRRPTRLTHTALAYTAVREALLASRARAFVVVLDCCFSGRAVETLGTGEIADLAAVRGGYVLAAASREEMALAPVGQPHTAFTGELIRLFTEGDPHAPLQITLRHAFDCLERAALARNFPLPRQRASGAITDLVLCTNPAYQPPRQQPTPLPEGNSAEDLCPYPGLAAFGPAQAQWFFGRENLCAELLRQLGRGMDQPGPVIVVGPSGSGKSSLLRAGLLPALAQGQLPVTGSRTWPRLVLTPTGEPLGELAAKLAEITGGCPPLPQNVADAPQWFIAAARELLRERSGGADAGRARLVVIVDQLEELFTVCAQESVRQAFLNALCMAATADNEGEPPVVVVFGVRADFYGRLAAYPALLPVLQDAQLVVGPMNLIELGEAITKPAELVGLTLQPGLRELLLRDLGDTGAGEMSGNEAGRLPLLAHALRVTWDQRSDHALTVGGYQATGGIQGAVATTAENVFNGLDSVGQHAARTLFLRLIQIGDCAEDTRRRLTHTELLQGLDKHTAGPVVDAFTRGRLVTQDQDSVEITHEALLRAWPRLRQWIDTDRAGNLTHQQLEDAAASWDRDRRDTAGLYRGSRLDTARTWADINGHVRDLSPTARDFLTASSQHQRRALSLRRTALVLVSVLALVASGAAIAAVKLRASAQAARATAVANQLTAIVGEAGRLRSTDVSLAAQLDIVAYRIHPTAALYADLITTENIPLSSSLTGRIGLLDAISFSPINSIMATSSPRGFVQLWDTTNRTQPKQVGTPLAGSDAAFSPTSPIMAVNGSNGKNAIQLWGISNSTQPKTLGPPLEGNTVAFSPDGCTLAVHIHNNNPIGSPGAFSFVTDSTQLWDITDPMQPKTLGSPLDGYPAAFSLDGHTLGIVSGGVQLWDITDPIKPKALGPPLNDPTTAQQPNIGPSVNSFAFSPDGRTLAIASTIANVSGGEAGNVQLWDIADHAHPKALGPPLPGAAIDGPTNNSIAFRSDGSILAVIAPGNNGAKTVQLWNISNRLQPKPIGQSLTDPNGSINSIAFNPDGDTLVTISNGGNSKDNSVQLWNVPPTILTGHTGRIASIAFSPNGSTLATAGTYETSGGVHVWDIINPARPTLLSTGFTETFSPNTLAFGRDGEILATSAGKVQLWNMNHPRRPAPIGQPFTNQNSGAGSIIVSHDGHTLATNTSIGSSTGVQLWDISDPTHPKPLGLPLPANQVAFSPTGTMMATFDSVVQLWNIADPAHPKPLGPPIPGGRVAFSPTSTMMATTSNDNNMTQLWDISDPTHPKPLGLPLPANQVTFSPTDTIIAVTDNNNGVKLWKISDPARPTVLASSFTDDGTIMFGPHGTLATTEDNDNTIKLWDVNVNHAIQRICDTTRNTLTLEKWRQYIPDLPYQPPCV